FAGSADRALSDAGRNILRRDLLYAAGADRAEVRYRRGAIARHLSRFRAAARPRLVALLHLAPFQTDAPRRDRRARAIAGRRGIHPGIAQSQLLERGRERSPSFARLDVRIARRRRLALFERHRLE